MKNIDTKILEQIGMTSSEIKVYFALLSLGSSSVGAIIERSKVPDSKIYFLLDKLKKKGLVSFVIKNNVKHFQSTDPRNLINMLEQRKQDIDKQKTQLEDLIPQIELARIQDEDRSEATVYESFDGLKSAFSYLLQTLMEGDEYQVFMLGEALADSKIVRFFLNYHKKRIEKNIKVRLISNSKYKKIIEKYHKYKGMKIRYTNQLLPVGIFIFKNHTMTVIFGENPTAFIIKSSKNYLCYLDFFNYLWEKRR